MTSVHLIDAAENYNKAMFIGVTGTIVAGLIVTLGMPPVGIGVLAVVAVIVIIHRIKGNSKLKKAGRALLL